jgi:hypothetical protein
MKDNQVEKEKAEFRTVAVPMKTYNQVKEMALREERSIARQISVIVEKVYNKSA